MALPFWCDCYSAVLITPHTVETLSLKTMKMFNSMHQKISTGCQEKLNAMGSSQIVEQ